MRIASASTLRRGSQITALVVGAGGLLVLVGWTFAVPTLKSVVADWPMMAPGTALGLVLASAALLIARPQCPRDRPAESTGWPTSRPWSDALAGVVLAIGVLRLGQYLAGWNLNLDHLWLFGPASAPGRISPATAFGLVMVAAAVTAANRYRYFFVFEVLVLVSGFNAWLGLSRYIFGGVPLLPFVQMGVHTAAALLLLSAALLCLRTDGGLMGLLLSDTDGGQILRYLLIPVLVAPLAAEWVERKFDRAGWFSPEAGMSLAALLDVVVLGALVWGTASLLQRTDRQRQKAEHKLRAQFERLSLLNEITKAIARRQDPHSIFQVVARRVEEDLPADLCGLCLADGGGTTSAMVCVGTKGHQFAAVLCPGGPSAPHLDPACFHPEAHERLVYIPDLMKVADPLAGQVARAGVRSLVTVPLKVDAEAVGMLVVGRQPDHAFDSGECEFLRQLSEHVALAAHQAQLRDSLRKAYDDLRLTQQLVVRQQRLRVIGEMASGIAHDINNAVSPALLSTDLLLAREPGLSGPARNVLNTVRRAVGDVAQIVGRMRDFYRQREPSTVLAPVDLNELVPQVLLLTQARWSSMANEQGVTIEARTELGPELPAIQGVESDIREALTNLVMNAVDAMPAGGTLTLRTKSSEGPSGGSRSVMRPEVYVEVTDTGVGMDEATRARCKELFFTTKGDRGTGLGLAMVHGAMQRHQGAMNIESAPGQGTTFRLRFPVPAIAATESVKTELVELRPSRSLRLLVIDDDPLILKMLESVLRTDGHTVVACDGGQKGIAAFLSALKEESAFDVVITDLGMPYTDGRKTAAAIKAVSATTPVILLTGWGPPVDGTGEAATGVDRVLGKPPQIQDLRAALAAVVK